MYKIMGKYLCKLICGNRLTKLLEMWYNRKFVAFLHKVLQKRDAKKQITNGVTHWLSTEREDFN